MLSSMVESFFTVLPRHLSRSNAECKEGGRSQTQCFLSYLNFVILLSNISEVVYKLILVALDLHRMWLPRGGGTPIYKPCGRMLLYMWKVRFSSSLVLGGEKNSDSVSRIRYHLSGSWDRVEIVWEWSWCKVRVSIQRTPPPWGGGEGDCSHCPWAHSQVLGWQIFSSPTKYSGHFCFTKALFGNHSHIKRIFGHSVQVTGHFQFSAIYLTSLTSAVSWVTTHQSHVACHTVRLMFDSSISHVTELTLSYY